MGRVLVYGVRLAEPVLCGEKEINGAVGLVSIEEIADQMRLESFDGQGNRRRHAEIRRHHYGEPAVQHPGQQFPDAPGPRPVQNGGSLEACLQAVEQGKACSWNTAWTEAPITPCSNPWTTIPGTSGIWWCGSPPR